MIALIPGDRPSFSEVLDSARDVAFPEAFYSFLYTYIMSINETSSHTVFARTASAQARSGGINVTSAANGANISGATGPESWGTLPSDSDHRMERIWGEFDSIEPILMTGEQIEQTITKLPPPRKVSLTSKPIQVSEHVSELSLINSPFFSMLCNIGYTPRRSPYSKSQHSMVR
jgi:phosphoinositide-3-kinase regulatory subunit 4